MLSGVPPPWVVDTRLSRTASRVPLGGRAYRVACHDVTVTYPRLQHLSVNGIHTVFSTEGLADGGPHTCTLTHTHTHMCMHTQPDIHTRTRTHAYTHTYMDSNTHIYTHNIGVSLPHTLTHIHKITLRSEERRVRKECRSRWSPYH